MPKVSVIIPTHNRADLLRQALDSVLRQSFDDLEVIIIDDASNDDTPTAVARQNDVRLRYFRNPENRGEAASRNAGIAHASGEYIAFLDDDDTWLPQKLERQMRLLDRCPVKVGAVYCGYYRVDMESGATMATTLPERRGAIYADLREQNWVGSPSTVVLRRECFDKVGLFDEQLEFGVDYDMWIRISRFYHVECVPEPLVRYSVHPDRLSADAETILHGKEAQLKKYSSYFAEDRRSYGRYLLSLGVLYCCNRKPAEGRAALRRAIRVYPFEFRPYFNLFLSLSGCDNFIRMKKFRDRLQRPFNFAGRR
jgi:glycosyltransferase involved in cell wall biosynthesis